MTSYVYNITTDFQYGLVNIDNLSQEIRQSSITVALDYISITGDFISIFFKAVLSDTDKTTLDGDTTAPAGGLIAQHSIEITEVHQMVKIQEESTATNGKWGGRAHWIIGATGPEISTDNDYFYAHPITALNFKLRTTEENMGDEIVICTIPDLGLGLGVIGTLQATAITGATGISVTSSMIMNVLTTDEITLSEGINEENLGRIKSIDKANNIIYITNPTQREFSVDTPTLIKLQRYILSPFHLGPPDLYTLGETKIGGSYIPTNHKIRIKYINNGNTSKRLYSIIEHLE